jgi:thiol-disulfide isomerase/thioredoxin
MMDSKLVLVISVLVLLFLSGCVNTKYESDDTSGIAPSSITTFQTIPNATICTEDGKPIIRLYSTTICPHCRWINGTFNGVVDEYKAKGLIVGYHWDLDVGNDQLTPAKESSIPKSEVELFTSTNPQQSVPTYLFGCKYWRVGNAYESQDDLDAEAAEFKAVIEKLLSEVNSSG